MTPILLCLHQATSQYLHVVYRIGQHVFGMIYQAAEPWYYYHAIFQRCYNTIINSHLETSHRLMIATLRQLTEDVNASNTQHTYIADPGNRFKLL